MDTPAITVGQLADMMDAVRLRALLPTSREPGETAAVLLGNINVLNTIARQALGNLTAGSEPHHVLTHTLDFNERAVKWLTREITRGFAA